MRWPVLTSSLLTLLQLALPAAAAAQKQEKELPDAVLTAELAMGLEYDSNVSVDEVDLTSNESDYAATLDAKLGVQKQFTQTAEASLSYDFGQTWYDQFSEVNRQTHILGAELKLDLARVDTGLSTYYIHSRLDGDAFLEIARASPYVSGFLGKKWFTRAAYAYSDKTLENNSDRDAKSDAGELDLYYFQRGLRSYFNLGYRFKDEDAVTDPYDFKSHAVKLRYVRRMEMGSQQLKMALAWRYEDRDYSAETPSIGEKRADERHRWQVDLEMPLGKKLDLLLYYEYSDYQSNLPRADYDRNLVGSQLRYRW